MKEKTAPATISNIRPQEPLQTCDKERILEQSREFLQLADEVLHCTFLPAKERRSVFLEVSHKANAMTLPVFRLDDDYESVSPHQLARSTTNGH